MTIEDIEVVRIYNAANDTHGRDCHHYEVRFKVNGKFISSLLMKFRKEETAKIRMNTFKKSIQENS